MNRQKSDSGSVQKTPAEMSKAHRNNTDKNKTDYSNTDILSYPDWMEKTFQKNDLPKIESFCSNGFPEDEKIH